MSIFRSYLSKNNTLIEDNLTNNSQNPVTEISYGTVNVNVSRYIFDVNVQPLIDKINSGTIPLDSIQTHVLRMTNTIRYRSDLIGGKFADGIQQRSGSFELELFNITEDWDEGNGYDFVYIDEQFPSIPQEASNWTNRKTTKPWNIEGAYISGGTTGVTASTSQILATQAFEKGNEDIYIDITDYINSKITTGITGFTATTFGLGIKFPNSIEILETTNRNAVAFHAKNTTTFYEPYIETYFDTRITDDRNFFFLDKDNELYLYSNVGGINQDVTINSVTILDYENIVVTAITGSLIQQVRTGVYKILLNLDSDIYTDAVLFTDRWNVTQNGKNKDIDQEFYLISQENYYIFTNQKSLNEENYSFNFRGILEKDKIKSEELRKISIDIKQFYPNQDKNVAFDVEYRLFVNQSDKYEIDVISWTKVDRTPIGYEFILDTSWLIPQDYFLEVRLVDGNTFIKKNPLKFTIISDGITGA